MSIYVLQDVVSGLMDDFIAVGASTHDTKILEGRTGWLLSIKQLFQLTALDELEEVAGFWEEISGHKDTGIKDFVVEGTSALWLGYTDAVWVRNVELGLEPKTKAAIWHELLADITTALQITRVQRPVGTSTETAEHQTLSMADRDFAERVATPEYMIEILAANPWLVLYYAITRIPLLEFPDRRTPKPAAAPGGKGEKNTAGS